MASESQPAEVGAATLSDQRRLVCLFHLNLAFSSLEEASHADVIRRCYRPALELAEQADFPIAIEATGWTLRRIAALDPGWIELARRLMAEGRLELVGSAHAQCAAPLLPAAVNAWNLRLGRESYRELLGVSPRVALVCEQVFSPGLVPLYLSAGYEAIIVDWDNAYRSHPDWPVSHRHHPQRARGGGSSIPIIWSESIVFQKFQRFAHGELSLDRYVDYVRSTGRVGSLMLYANDVEIFDHRPGRFLAEPQLQAGEWDRIAAGLRALRERAVGVPVLPSQLLELLDAADAGHELELQAPAEPIQVKKQDKYNVTRWAVSGRDDIGINTRCWRLYERLQAEGCIDPDRWRELCELWASDFRTHITESRWVAYLARLEQLEQRWSGRGETGGRSRGAAPTGVAPTGVAQAGFAPTPSAPTGSASTGFAPTASAPTAFAPIAESSEQGAPRSGTVSAGPDQLQLCSGTLRLALNTRRGMAIEAFTDTALSELPLLGTLEHGYFPTIDLGADFYSGHLVQESPLTHKITDLERVTPTVGLDGQGRLCAAAQIETELGPIEKTIRLDADSGALQLEWLLRWPELPLGSLRLGHVTLSPEAFQARTLFYATHNGGSALETHRIAGPAFDHGGAVSALVSCRQGLGMTEGLMLVGDATHMVAVEIDQAFAKPLGLISWVPGARRWFLRLSFTLTESDETRRGGIARGPHTPQRIRLRISLKRTPPELSNGELETFIQS